MRTVYNGQFFLQHVIIGSNYSGNVRMTIKYERLEKLGNKLFYLPQRQTLDRKNRILGSEFVRETHV